MTLSLVRSPGVPPLLGEGVCQERRAPWLDLGTQTPIRASRLWGLRVYEGTDTHTQAGNAVALSNVTLGVFAQGEGGWLAREG